jgi:hypothetical protein
MTVLLVNTSDRPVRGTLTAVPSSGSGGALPASPWAQAHSMPVTVPPDGQTSVGPAQLGATAVVGAAVVLDGGGVAVAVEVASPLGWAMAPCASSTAQNWYFAHGATAEGSGLLLSLFNPEASNATVDVSLVSQTAGLLQPAAYQGIDVPPGSLVTENLGDHAADDPSLAAEVSTLAGSVVAAELESVGAPGSGGLSLTLGAPAPSTNWTFAQSTDLSGGSVAFHVLNPTGRSAAVSVALGLEGAAAEPLAVRVGPESVSTLATQNLPRIPPNAAYSATFTSLGTGVVVDRQVSAPTGLPAPVPEDGHAPGVAAGRDRWVLPGVLPPGTGAWTLAISNVGARPATVRIESAGGEPVAGQPPRSALVGSPLVIGPNPGPPFGTAPLRVVSNQPVTVELDALPAAGPGVVVVPALPLP